MKEKNRVNHGEAGEGVVSAAIAVLIMAFLGAAMYFTFSRVLDKSGEKIDQQVDCIGQSAPGGFCSSP